MSVIGFPPRRHPAIGKRDLQSYTQTNFTVAVTSPSADALPGDSDERASIESVANAIPIRRVDDAKVDPIRSRRLATRVDRGDLQAWLECDSLGHQEANAEDRDRNQECRHLRIVQPEEETSIDAELDRATVAARPLRLGQRRDCDEQQRAENYDSSYHEWRKENETAHDGVSLGLCMISDDRASRVSQIRHAFL